MQLRWKWDGEPEYDVTLQRHGGVCASADLPRHAIGHVAVSEVRRTPATVQSAVLGVMVLATVFSGPAVANVLDDWRGAAELGCPGVVGGGAPFAAPGFVELPEDGIGRVYGAGPDVRARVRELDGRRVCELSAGGARVAPHVPAALEAFLDWADARVATGDWRYGDASRERRVVPVAARIVATRPNARGCGVEAVLLGDPYGGHVSLTVAETAPEGGGACARPDG